MATGTKKSKKCGCAVETVLATPFKTMKLEEKIKLMKMGRPKHDLNLDRVATSARRRTFTLHFRTKLYDLLPWLCGCRAKNKLFCWPCLLFSNEETVWSTTGFDNLHNFAKTEKRHRFSRAHIISLKELKKVVKVFGKDLKCKPLLTKNERQEIELFNLKVANSRTVFKHLIRIVSTLGRLGFDLENSESPCDGRRHYTEIVKLVASYNTDLMSFVTEKKGDVYLEMKFLTVALAECVMKVIKQEVSQTDFISLILDGVTDSAMNPYMATTLRYIKKNGGLVERFVHFSERRLVTATAVFQHVQQVLKEFNCASKLVAYTYDGSVMTANEHANLQDSIRKECRGALFVHYYAHRLSFVLMQSVCHIGAVKVFFSSLSNFGDFFGKSAKCVEALIMFNPIAASIKWDDPIRLVEYLYNHRDAFQKFLIYIDEKADEWDAETVSSATSLLALLKDFDFNFFLAIFSCIFLRCDILFQILQSKLSDLPLCANRISEFQGFLEHRKGNFSSFWQDIVRSVPVTYSARKHMVIPSGAETNKSTYESLYLEVFNRLISTCKERFGDLEKLAFFCILDQNLFKKHNLGLPKRAISCLTDNYVALFNPERLKSELVAVYFDPEFRSVFDLYGYMKYQELDDVFPETYKLSKLMRTIPATSRPVSATERIRSYVQSGQVSVSSLLCIENELLEELVDQDSFLEKVLDEFAVKQERQDLLFKGLQKDASQGDKFSTDAGSSVDVESDTNLLLTAAASDMVVELDPTTFVPSDSEEPDPSDLCEAGPSSRVEPDSSMMEEEHLAMTCEVYPVKTGPDSPSMDIKIKEEPEDTFKQDILSATVERELYHFSKDTRAAISIEESLFQPPVLIKEEPVSSEEDP